MFIYSMAISATANLGPVTTIANIGQREVAVPEVGDSVFVIPDDVAKNGHERIGRGERI